MATTANGYERAFCPVLLTTARVVKMSGREIQFFHTEKDAKAFILHTYGVRAGQASKLGITCEPIVTRGPRPGDAVNYIGNDKYYVDAFKGGQNVMETLCGDLAVCCGASVFRDDKHVSCSGGPVPFVSAKDLTFAGFKRVMFWRWHDGSSGAHMGGNYEMLVPCWDWSGNDPDPTKG